MSGDVASKYIAIVGLILILVAVPGAFCYLLSRDMEEIRTKKFELGYGPLIEGLKLNSKKYLSYYILFVVRRLTFFSLAIA